MDRYDATRCTFDQILVGIHVEVEALCLQVTRWIKRCLLISLAWLSGAEAATGQVSRELGLADRHAEVSFSIFSHLSRPVVDFRLVIVIPLNRVEALRTPCICTEIKRLKVRVYHIVAFGHRCSVSTQVLTLVIPIVHANNGLLLQKAILGR